MTHQDLFIRLKRLYYSINCRCNCKSHPKFKHYGGKGIKNLLSKEDLMFLWVRDEAVKLQKPSIDRINSNGNYELNNCRFIEQEINCSVSYFKKKPIDNKNKRWCSNHHRVHSKERCDNPWISCRFPNNKKLNDRQKEKRKAVSNQL